MTYHFGDWLKHEREKRMITQEELAYLTNNKVNQSLISKYERNFIDFPATDVLIRLVNALGLTLKSVPFDHFSNEKGKGSDAVVCRFSLYDLPQCDTVRTFNGKTYEVKGFVGVEKENGEIKKISELYYDIKTVVKNSKIEAKRKNKNDELVKLKNKKKIK